LRIRLLPSSAGRDSQLQCLTSFLIDNRVAVDGGSLGFALVPEEIGTIRDIIITHSHADHTASLPIYVAEAFSALTDPIVIYGSDEVIATLRKHVFNDHVWPDFEKIPLPTGKGPTVEFKELRAGEKIKVADLDVTPISVNHLVPTFGLMVEGDGVAVIFTSDTYSTDEIWQVAKANKGLRAVFVDVSFPNEMGQLAEVSKHLTPVLLAKELEKLDRAVEVYAVHIKPTHRDQVINELAELSDPQVRVGEIGHIYEW
jgi:cAMP phosphodiesterase